MKGGSWKQSGLLLFGMLFASILVLWEGQGNSVASAIKAQTASQLIDTHDFTAIAEGVDEHTLVLVDLDNTLIRSKTQAGGAEWCYYQRDKYVAEGLSKGEAIDHIYPMFCDLQRQVEAVLCDEKAPQLIEEMRRQGAIVLGLTHRQPRIAVRTLEQLASVGIQFSQPSFSTERLVFSAPFPSAYSEGVIFVGDRNDKGEVLKQFLRQYQGTVTKIVFVDDVLKNVEAVEKAASANGLDYVGIRYGAMDERKANFRNDISEIQERYRHTVMPDALAQHLLSTEVGPKLLASYVDPIAHSTRMDKTLVPGQQLSVTLPEPQPEQDVAVNIVETTEFADVLRYADAETLLVFDLNDTLMSTSVSLGGDVWAKKILTKHMSNGMTKSEALDRLVPYWHKVLLAAPVEAVQPEIPLILRQLSNRGCQMLGLTARYVEMAYATTEQLATLSIDFSRNALAKDDVSLHTPYPSKYINGVIFAGLQNNKADVLLQFLKQNPATFNKIVFVDDKKKNVDGLAKAARVLGVPYVGVWYRAAAEKAQDVDPNTAKVQAVLFDQLIADEVAAFLVD